MFNFSSAPVKFVDKVVKVDKVVEVKRAEFNSIVISVAALIIIVSFAIYLIFMRRQYKRELNQLKFGCVQPDCFLQQQEQEQQEQQEH